MRELRTIALFVFAVLQVLIGPAVGGIEIDEAGEGTFNSYLIKKMTEYKQWIRNNQLDPLPPIPENVTLPSYYNPYLEMNCTVTEQTLSGSSNTSGDYNGAATTFGGHSFTIFRRVVSPYIFQGNYDCTGILYDSDSEEIVFSGNGTYTLQTDTSGDYIEYHNVGITENYTFNLTHSWLNYIFDADTEQVKLVGTWSSDLITDRMQLLEELFGNMYSKFLSIENSDVNPCRKMIVGYVDEFIRNTNLAEILSPEELPDIYFPTSTTTEKILSFDN